MTPKQRMLVALDGGVPDRLPATTHFMMPQFLESCMGGISEDEFFDTCGWDPITYTTPHRPDPAARRVLRSEPGRAGLPGEPADRQRPVARRSRAGRRGKDSTFCRNGLRVLRRRGASCLLRAPPRATGLSRPGGR